MAARSKYTRVDTKDLFDSPFKSVDIAPSKDNSKMCREKRHETSENDNKSASQSLVESRDIDDGESSSEKCKNNLTSTIIEDKRQTISPSQSPESASYHLGRAPFVGMLVDACDQEYIWSSARIVRVYKKKMDIIIRYTGWGEEWDENISRFDERRLAKHGTYTMQFKCMVDLFGTSKSSTKSPLWPCIVHVRLPSPLEPLEEYESAEDGLRLENNIFIVPYGKNMNYLPREITSTQVNSGRWVNINSVHKRDYGYTGKKKSSKMKNNFYLAYKLACKDDTIPEMTDDIFEEGTLIREKYRQHPKEHLECKKNDDDGKNQRKPHSIIEAFEIEKNEAEEPKISNDIVVENQSKKNNNNPSKDVDNVRIPRKKRKTQDSISTEAEEPKISNDIIVENQSEKNNNDPSNDVDNVRIPRKKRKTQDSISTEAEEPKISNDIIVENQSEKNNNNASMNYQDSINTEAEEPLRKKVKESNQSLEKGRSESSSATTLYDESIRTDDLLDNDISAGNLKQITQLHSSSGKSSPALNSNTHEKQDDSLLASTKLPSTSTLPATDTPSNNEKCSSSATLNSSFDENDDDHTASKKKDTTGETVMDTRNALTATDKTCTNYGYKETVLMVVTTKKCRIHRQTHKKRKYTNDEAKSLLGDDLTIGEIFAKIMTNRTKLTRFYKRREANPVHN